MKKPKINYDAKSDVFYVILKEGYEEKHEEISPGVYVERDKKGEILGLEILNASENIGRFFKKSISSKFSSS